MSKFGGDDSRLVRGLVLVLVVVGLLVGGVIVKSMTDAGRAAVPRWSSGSMTCKSRRSSVRTDFAGGARPEQVEIVTIDGVDRDDCVVQGPDEDPELSCAVARGPPAPVGGAREREARACGGQT